MFYDIRIEPKKDLSSVDIQKIIINAFEEYGGLTNEGVQLINID